MNDIPELLFFLLCLLFWVSALASMAWRYVRQRRAGSLFPPISSHQIKFNTRSASGRSHQTWFTRIGGARNCLHVTVTDTEIWIRLSFPFNLLPSNSDLEHRIPISAITNVQRAWSLLGRVLLLDYRDQFGDIRRLSLQFRQPNGFLSALGLPTMQANEWANWIPTWVGVAIIAAMLIAALVAIAQT